MTSRDACAECREQLPWYVAGTLPPDERDAVEDHLAGCDACRRELALWRAVGSTLEGMVAEPPPPAILEGMTWRAIQAKIEASGGPTAGRAVGTRRMKERMRMNDETEPGATGLREPPSPPRASAGPSRRQPFVALAAAVLIITLGVTLFGVYGARLRQGGSSSATPRQTVGEASCPPGQIKAHLPANTTLSDISMVSNADGWAAGEVWDARVSGSLPRTIMMRYQHCVWSEVGQSIPSAALLNIVMTSESDGWAMGATAVSQGSYWLPGQLILLHYTGGAWRRVDLNSGNGFQGDLLRMSSQNDGWLDLVYGEGQISTLFHYRGSAWTKVALPGAFQSGGRIIDLATGGPDDVWIAGNVANSVATIGHYSAGQWRTWRAPLVGGHTPMLDAIHVTSPQDAWVFGRYSYVASGGYNDAPYALHYDGTSWKRVSIGSLGNPTPDVMFWSTAIAQPDGSLLALGSESLPTEKPNSSNQHTLTLRCTASGCQPQAFPIVSVAFIYTVSLYTPSRGFAVADVRNGGPDRGTAALLAYNAGEWAQVPD